MTETLLDTTSIGSGNSATATFGHPRDSDVAVLQIDGDSNSTDLDVQVTGAAFTPTAAVTGAVSFTSQVTGVDATGDTIVRLSNLDHLGHVEVTVTNNAASATTITVTEDHF